MPPVLGPWPPSRRRLKSCAGCRATTSSPSHRQNSDTSGPSRYSSTTTTPRGTSRQAAAWASAATAVVGDDDALARGEPVVLDHVRGAELVEARPRPASRSWQTNGRAVGTPAAAMTSLAKALLDSSRAAAADGPKHGMPVAARTMSAAPATSGASGPMTTRSASAAVASSAMPLRSCQVDVAAVGALGGHARVARARPPRRSRRPRPGTTGRGRAPWHLHRRRGPARSGRLAVLDGHGSAAPVVRSPGASHRHPRPPRRPFRDPARPRPAAAARGAGPGARGLRVRLRPVALPRREPGRRAARDRPRARRRGRGGRRRRARRARSATWSWRRSRGRAGECAHCLAGVHTSCVVGGVFGGEHGAPGRAGPGAAAPAAPWSRSPATTPARCPTATGCATCSPAATSWARAGTRPARPGSARARPSSWSATAPSGCAGCSPRARQGAGARGRHEPPRGPAGAGPPVRRHRRGRGARRGRRAGRARPHRRGRRRRGARVRGHRAVDGHRVRRRPPRRDRRLRRRAARRRRPRSGRCSRRNVGLAGGVAPVRAYLPDLLAAGRSRATSPPARCSTGSCRWPRPPQAYDLMDRREAIKVLLRP